MPSSSLSLNKDHSQMKYPKPLQKQLHRKVFLRSTDFLLKMQLLSSPNEGGAGAITL